MKLGHAVKLNRTCRRVPRLPTGDYNLQAMSGSDSIHPNTAQAESARGRLKVFLGYAPGVGKSFRMFDEARRRKKRGQDVVVGALQPLILFVGEMLTATAMGFFPEKSSAPSCSLCSFH